MEPLGRRRVVWKRGRGIGWAEGRLWCRKAPYRVGRCSITSYGRDFRRSLGPIQLTASCAEQAATASRTATTQYCLCNIAASVGLGARLAWCVQACKLWPQLRDGCVRTACNLPRPLRRRLSKPTLPSVRGEMPNQNVEHRKNRQTHKGRNDRSRCRRRVGPPPACHAAARGSICTDTCSLSRNARVRPVRPPGHPLSATPQPSSSTTSLRRPRSRLALFPPAAGRLR